MLDNTSFKYEVDYIENQIPLKVSHYGLQNIFAGLLCEHLQTLEVLFGLNPSLLFP